MRAGIMRRAAVCWLALVTAIAVADDEAPDIEFLEYLGSWDESDEDWLLFDEDGNTASTREETAPTDGAPDTERSTEQDNER